jgi:hypothetical protein
MRCGMVRHRRAAARCFQGFSLAARGCCCVLVSFAGCESPPPHTHTRTLTHMPGHSFIFSHCCQDFEDQIFKDLYEAIVEEFPAPPERRSSLDLERSYHMHFVEDKSMHFIGRTVRGARQLAARCCFLCALCERGLSRRASASSA